ncbi:MAG: NfeD family protein, partial [Gemmatimonadales bacterium]
RILALAACLVGAVPAVASAQSPVIYRIPITGVIENGLAPYVARAIKAAEAANASAIVLDIDTPGGRVDAAERIVDAVQGASVPVYAYINPRAYSAGAMIALAAKGVFMQPTGVVGAATPVDGEGTKASEKMVSAMRAAFRAMAEARGIDPRLAEGMVDETIEVPGVKPAGVLLTLTASEALQHRFAQDTARSLEAVATAIGVPNAAVQEVPINWAERLVRFFTHPIVSPLLLSLGMLGLVFEIKSGAFGLGGAVSLGALGLFFGSGVLLGLAGWEEVILLGLGLAAIGVEVFLLPGFGVAGVLGLGLVGTSVILAMVSGMPTGSDLVQAGAILVAALVITLAVAFAWIRHLPNSRRFGKALHGEEMSTQSGYISAPPRPDLIGRTGRAVTDLRPAGVVEIDNERVDVVTEGEYLAAGTAVAVIRAESYRHIVRAANEQTIP